MHCIHIDIKCVTDIKTLKGKKFYVALKNGSYTTLTKFTKILHSIYSWSYTETKSALIYDYVHAQNFFFFFKFFFISFNIDYLLVTLYFFLERENKVYSILFGI